MVSWCLVRIPALSTQGYCILTHDPRSSLTVLTLRYIHPYGYDARCRVVTRVKKRVSERVFPRVMHVIQSKTLGKMLGEHEKSRQASPRESRIGLYTWLLARLSQRLVVYTRGLVGFATCKILMWQVDAEYNFDVSSLLRVRFWCVQLQPCRILTGTVGYVYGSDVSSWCFVDIWLFEFLACTVIIRRIWCVYGLNLSSRCCVELVDQSINRSLCTIACVESRLCRVLILQKRRPAHMNSWYSCYY